MFEQYFPIAVLTILAVGLSLIVVFISIIFGPRKQTEKKLATYESGMAPIGPGIRRFPIRFYLVAVLFILFDVEVIFLLPYAVTARELGIYGLITTGVFIVVLTVGLFYEWKKGALEWQ
ncbi:MAG: NAD(P)H-quinone oxidoreductase subunit 3 [Chloroflexi bacterium]|nr:NAD(P)H-quinone oxidoreductase subunit 3 [Chloroflexota bacterium]